MVEGDPAVHRAAVQRLRRADAGRRVPQRRRAPSKLAQVLQDAQGGRTLHLRPDMEQADQLGQPRVWLAASSSPNGERVRARDGLGRGPRPRRRQHRLGHGSRDSDNIVWGTFADDGDNIVWGTCSGWRQHRLGHRLRDNIVWGTDCGGADCDNIVWGTLRAERRQHRVGHAARRSTTSCGARCVMTATTSSGARCVMRRQHRLGHARRWRQHHLGHLDRRRTRRGGNGPHRRSAIVAAARLQRHVL